jgi:hypothetical protein
MLNKIITLRVAKKSQKKMNPIQERNTVQKRKFLPMRLATLAIPDAIPSNRFAINIPRYEKSRK